MSYPSPQNRARMRLVKVYQMEDVGDFEQGPSAEVKQEHQEQARFCWDTCGDPLLFIPYFALNSRGVFLVSWPSPPMIEFSEQFPGMN